MQVMTAEPAAMYHDAEPGGQTTALGQCSLWAVDDEFMI